MIAGFPGDIFGDLFGGLFGGMGGFGGFGGGGPRGGRRRQKGEDTFHPLRYVHSILQNWCQMHFTNDLKSIPFIQEIINLTS